MVVSVRFALRSRSLSWMAGAGPMIVDDDFRLAGRPQLLFVLAFVEFSLELLFELPFELPLEELLLEPLSLPLLAVSLAFRQMSGDLPNVSRSAVPR